MTPAVILSETVLCDFARQILEALFVPSDKARLVADSLVTANLRGVDSHGVQLLPHYARQLEAENVDARTDGSVVSESGSCLVYDGRNGIGQWISEICCRHVVRLTQQHGLGMVVARDSNHFGAAAYWAERISAAGFIGIVMCNASPMVPPWQGKDPRFGTNPICMSVPSSGDGGWLLDMATTTVAMGKIYRAAFNHQDTIPPGWAMDSEGVPTTETQTALNGLLMPLGGYKGSGLAMMAEILCAVLGGGAISTEIGGLRILSRPMRPSQMFLGIDVGRFLPLEEFRARMEHLVTLVKSARPAAGYDEVLVAGDPEWRAEAERREQGIPIEAGVWQSLCEIADRLRIPKPQ
jgi:LDH2 family malate/lactate/ureidoglycolate dehydrogenase